ncbi:hypothetical protein O0I10_000652 [Lichtheimia ornata]|uniref:Uncharacterized protein n=1 Tax=Lichtheimia ornata TaxID=688661 RepID=A0AAD7Y420_9FUNG|nr:uncharacterized protein O0I10_000652 [Lichtheimia ornata]KAJ8663413.1 hypothetical protein O0I10_000652 [Lichtheimia ornata]
METQSVWRRGHFLFDVHSGGHPFTNSPGTNERASPDLLMPNSQGCTTTTTTLALDHGLIYHNPTLPLESVSSSTASMTTIRRPFVRFPPFQSHYDHGLPMYQGGDFDSFFADKEREQPVFGGEHNEVFRICPSSIHKTTMTTTSSDPHHYRLKTPEKRESSTDSSDDDYSHKRPKI